MNDPFLTEIVNLVRGMSDQAILALVRDKVGPLAEFALAQRASRGRGRRSAPASDGKASATAPAGRGASKKARRRGPRRDSEAHAKALASVERTVKASKGLSASEVAKATGVPRRRVGPVLRQLKKIAAIFQGGDRRFARYAGDEATATQASLEARGKTTSGTAVKTAKKRRGSKKP